MLRKKGQIWQQGSVSSFIEELASKLGRVLFTEFKARGGHCRLMEVWAKRASQWLGSKGVSGTLLGQWGHEPASPAKLSPFSASSAHPVFPSFLRSGPGPMSVVNHSPVILAFLLFSETLWHVLFIPLILAPGGSFQVGRGTQPFLYCPSPFNSTYCIQLNSIFRSWQCN